MKLQFKRLEIMWAKWTGSTFKADYLAGGWLRCWYIGRLRIGWRLKRCRADKWNSQPTSTVTNA